MGDISISPWGKSSRINIRNGFCIHKTFIRFYYAIKKEGGGEKCSLLGVGLDKIPCSDYSH
jgi:hypothetical protein